MKNILYTIILSFLFSSVCLADFQAGKDAYDAGDYEVAFRLIKLLAEQGDPWAQYKIGQMYDEGKGVTQDYKEAVKWYRLAAEQGDADAQNSLGYMYQNGEGVTQDYKEAEKWYRLATKQGDASAQFNLGVMYQAGYGVTKDYQEALKWFRLAAAQGLAQAQFNLGQMYVKGQGVTQDYKEATKWWRLAAEQGDVEAQYNLGVMYSQGKGPTQDYKEAAKWYRLAAAQGFVNAQYNLAVMYVFGQGVIKNHVVAHMWTNIAARNGHEAAKKSRDFLAKKMKPKQIAKAKELARECIKKNYKDCVNSSLNIEKLPNKTTDKTVETIKTKDSVSADFQAGLDAYEAGDYETALKIYRAAAEQGHGKAQIHVSLMYSNGEGVAVDYVMGYMWLTTTLSNKNQKYDSVLTAQTLRKKLSKLMTSEQKSKALELARFCVRKNYKNCNNFSLSIEKAEALEANAKAKEKAKELKRKPNKAIDNFRSFKTECIKTKYKSEDCKRQFPDASSNIEKSP